MIGAVPKRITGDGVEPLLGDALLGQLYRTPDSEQAWVPLLDELCLRFGTGNAAVQVLRARADRLDQMWLARDSRSHANATAHDRWLSAPDNPRLTGVGPRSRTEINSDLRVFSSRPKVLQAVRQGLAEIGLGAGFWVSFPLAANRHFTLILHRHAGDLRDIQPKEERFFQAFLPHLRQAVGLATRLRDLSETSVHVTAAANAVGTATVVCDGNLHVVWRNDAATVLLARSPHLSIRQDRLWNDAAPIMKALHDLVRQRLHGAVALPPLTLGVPGDMPLQVKATGMQPGAVAIDDTVALVLAEPERAHHVSSDELACLFGLTAAEARLATAVAAGESVQDYAQRRRITEGTVRLQLKHVLAKTGAARQADLVRLVMASVAGKMPACP
jgi:DNA-binding CsgD family transcriptional regulator